MPTTVHASPADARAARIRRLAALISKASAELETLLAAEHRGRRLRGSVPTHLAAVPDNTKPADVRAWAEEQGLIEPGLSGRLAGHVWAAYAQAHR